MISGDDLVLAYLKTKQHPEYGTDQLSYKTAGLSQIGFYTWLDCCKTLSGILAHLDPNSLLAEGVALISEKSLKFNIKQYANYETFLYEKTSTRLQYYDFINLNFYMHVR